MTWSGNDRATEPLSYEQLETLPYLTYSMGPLASMIDTLLEELDHPRTADTVVESFLLGSFLLRGTPQITFLQSRLAQKLKHLADLNHHLASPLHQSAGASMAAVAHPRARPRA